jgi:hypothetical protein
MTIKLRTGSNLDMKDIQVVATGQDGSVAGKFDWDCPDVTPQSAIYFYEFTAPGAAAEGAQWTTRFTIADATGATTPPENAAQPDGDAIPWGVGALAAGGAAPVVPVPGASGAASSSGAASGSAAVPASTGAGPAGASSKIATSTRSSAASNATASKGANAAAASGSPNAASALKGSLGEARLMGVVAFLGTTAMAFVLVL